MVDRLLVSLSTLLQSLFQRTLSFRNCHEVRLELLQANKIKGIQKMNNLIS